jgi:hypothetical protein
MYDSAQSRLLAPLRNEAQPSSPVMAPQDTTQDDSMDGALYRDIHLSLETKINSGVSDDDDQSYVDGDAHLATHQRCSSESGSGEEDELESAVVSLVDMYGQELSTTREEDNITDTVGAIAIDSAGRIAAGSSSGGIGMKHGGRIGPAALVGIGTAVMPKDPKDRSGTCVATVMSGTGEHMATTMAASSCANRIYCNTKKGRSSYNVDTEEEDAIKNFVLQDFMSKLVHLLEIKETNQQQTIHRSSTAMRTLRLASWLLRGPMMACGSTLRIIQTPS